MIGVVIAKGGGLVIYWIVVGGFGFRDGLLDVGLGLLWKLNV